MPQDAIVVKGWTQLAEGSALLAGNIERDTAQRFGGVAQTVAGQTAGAVPVVSGQLAASVSVDPGPPVRVGIGGGVPYAGWIIFGGAGRPYLASGRYLFPEAQAAEPELEAAAETSAETEIARMQWPTPT